MPAKLRLQRFGKKGYPFYHIVVADSRAPRDGKFIERIGSYNPNTNPATIDLDTDKAVSWLQKGAQPTDTTRAILSYKGVLFKKHLAEGVRKGALTQEQADSKFEAWSSTKSGKIESKKSNLADRNKKDIEQRLQAERKVKEERAKAIEAKNTPQPETPAETAEIANDAPSAPENA